MGRERRRAERQPVDLAGALLLSGGRRVPVRIRNIGRLGALLQITDLEEAVLEGERAVLLHPVMDAADPPAEEVHTPCAIVRVELDFEVEGVKRELAVYFDGGPPPEDVPGA